MTQLSRAEFATNLLASAAPAARVAEVVSQFIDEAIEVGPVAVGPGGMGSARAVGEVSTVIVAAIGDGEWDYLISIPVELSVSVRLAGREVQYDIDLVVRTRVRLLLEAPAQLCSTSRTSSAPVSVQPLIPAEFHRVCWAGSAISTAWSVTAYLASSTT